MPDIVCVRMDWDRTALPLRIASRFYTLHIDPEPGHPFGRKGLALASAWEQLATADAAGMLLLDGDVAIDPHDFDQMLAAVDARPGIVHTAPVRLWPVSTKAAHWVWGHGRGGHTQNKTPAALDTFTFCFTYLPRVLIDACAAAGLAGWRYPDVDRNTVQVARQLRLPVALAAGAWPKHCNY